MPASREVWVQAVLLALFLFDSTHAKGRKADAQGICGFIQQL